MHRILRALPALTLLAVMTITASAEYELARTVLALPPAIAWALPVAIDSYVLAALRSGRDVRAAIAVMAGSLFASMGAHLAAAGHGGALPTRVAAPSAAVIMTVLVVVAWRVHVVLLDHGQPKVSETEGSAAPPASPASPSASPRSVEASVPHASEAHQEAQPASIEASPHEAQPSEATRHPASHASTTRPHASQEAAPACRPATRQRPTRPSPTVADLATAARRGTLPKVTRDTVKAHFQVGSSTADRLIKQYREQEPEQPQNVVSIR